MSDLKRAFEAALEEVKQLPKRPDNQTLLRLYALFKQSTEGDVSGKRPGFTDLVGRAKYDAWCGLKCTSKDDAMRAYVGLVQDLQAKAL